ncbi:helix-turn-helix domain-containing protein [Clostridium thermarum]|uniref:helix-turn-helix domain-containing protein n=1 Tax=Clostridium thermarum TaxID=1716543 RepID=UPI00111E3D02|nr:AraC family transcriptional regulator [Clostridium thermarum]
MENKLVSQGKEMMIETEIISPTLLRCHLFKGSVEYENGQSLRERYVINYEIEYITSGGGGMWINNSYYNLAKGDIIFRRPGDYTQAIMPYDCYCVFFTLKPDDRYTSSTYDIYGDFEPEDYYTNEIIDKIPVQFHTINGDKYLTLFDSILGDFINPTICSKLTIKSNLLQLITDIYTDATNPFNKPGSMEDLRYNELKEVVDFINTHYDEDISLKLLSQKVNLSPNYFHRLFHKIIGVTPNEYINKIRIEKSKEMLLKTRYSISEIALRCGFDSLSYFSYLFKKKTELSPLEFRKMHQLYR